MFFYSYSYSWSYSWSYRVYRPVCCSSWACF